MTMPATATGAHVGRTVYLAACALIFAFLVAPILVIIPLSFNAEPYFTFTEGMLHFDPDAYSLRWYREIVENDAWARALGNSLLIGVAATVLATALGTLAALGLASRAMPARRAAMGLLISPMVTPLIISAAGMFFFYSTLGLSQTHVGLILAHAALGTPFVVITVTATLSAFDTNLTRAAASLGAGTAAHIQTRAATADRARRALRRALRVRGVVRRGGGGAVHGGGGPAHHPASDVGRHPRADQPGHPGPSRRSWSYSRCCCCSPSSGCGGDQALRRGRDAQIAVGRAPQAAAAVDAGFTIRRKALPCPLNCGNVVAVFSIGRPL